MPTAFLHSKPLFLLAWLSLFLFAACKDSDDGPFPKHEGERTILIYQCAQNSLGFAGDHRLDSLELISAKDYIPANARLLVFTDDGLSLPRLYRYERGKKSPTLVRRWDKAVCASDPAVLSEVLSWVREKFPSREYGLVFWSHADGWLPATNTDYLPVRPRSFGIDVGTGGNRQTDRSADGRMGAQMDVEDLATAIANSGIHARYVFFDACLMQSLEVAYALRGVTDYIVASPIATPSQGAHYGHCIRKGFFSEDPADIARTFFADVTSDPEVSPTYEGYGLVVSCLRTDALEELARVTSEVLARSALMNHTSPDMMGVQAYQRYHASYFLRPHAYDALATMRHLLSSEDFALWQEAFNRAVVYKDASSRFWVGPEGRAFFAMDTSLYGAVSMFVPQTLYTERATDCAFGDHNENFRLTSWYRATHFSQTGW